MAIMSSHFSSIIFGANNNGEVNILILLLLEGPVVTVGRENIVTISASHEDLNNRSMNETVCSEVTLRWWGIGKGLIKS